VSEAASGASVTSAPIASATNPSPSGRRSRKGASAPWAISSTVAAIAEAMRGEPARGGARRLRRVDWRRPFAVAVLLLVWSPLAGIAAHCGCPPDACPVHRVPAGMTEHACHEMAAASGAACSLVAPCRHASGSTPVLALPPAILTSPAALPAPAFEKSAVSSVGDAALPLASPISTPPPRSPAV
jgi:hypothetical protein